jgi:hypothetical protein
MIYGQSAKGDGEREESRFNTKIESMGFATREEGDLKG